jgi:predicted DNA-binding transcriptional regulator AlpA
MMASKPPPRGSRIAQPIGWLEAEIDHYLQNAVRVSRGLEPLPPPPPPGPDDKVTLLREREVHRRNGIGRVMRWKLEAKGRFPRRVKLPGFGDTADAT